MGGSSTYNVFNTCIEDAIFDADYTRHSALRKCVFRVPYLYHEFKETLDNTEDAPEISRKLREFIKKKNLRITSEKLIARVVNDKYVLDVYFTINW